jgi:hypothetical protein
MMNYGYKQTNKQTNEQSCSWTFSRLYKFIAMYLLVCKPVLGVTSVEVGGPIAVSLGLWTTNV